MTIGSWGGAYQTAQQSVLFDGFTSRTGIPVEPVTLTTLNSVREAVAAPGRKLAVVDLPADDAEAACAEGLAQPVDASVLGQAQGDDAPERDFILPVGPCGVPSTVMADVVLYDKEALASHAPSRASDIFDLVNFPGRRALKRDAEGTLEWALLADGVAPNLIYTTLATPQGADRAFARLDQIRDSVLWWDHGDVPIKALARKDVVMAASYGARAYQAIVGDGQAFGIVWSGALVTANRWLLLKSASDPVTAREFIKFATDRERQAELARILPYGPARRSAIKDLPAEKVAFLASAPEHLGDALIVDSVFWLKNGAPLRQRFAAWLATASAPQPVKPATSKPAAPPPPAKPESAAPKHE